MKQQSRASSTTLKQLEVALEVCCDALMAVVAMSAHEHDAESQLHDVEHRITRAINSLRGAMAELRLAQSEETSALAFGFILGEATRSYLDDRDDYVSPR